MSKELGELLEKWEDVLDHKSLPAIPDYNRRAATAVMLENAEKELKENRVHIPSQLMIESAIPVNFMGASSSTAGSGGIDTFDPVMISLVRRSAPNLIAYDLCGVQPMTGPTGLIFALRSRYSNQTGTETFYNEVNTMFSSVLGGANTFGDKHVGTLPGNSTATGNLASTGIYNTGTGMSRAQAEALGTSGNSAWPKMAFTVEKQMVEANSRALASEYTLELAQDLKAVHGLDARTELVNILSTEILAEINREILRTINHVAKIGCQENTTTAGIFDLDTDSNGRWSVEKWKGLMFQMEREANQIAKQTRRGKGNVAIMTSDVASALIAAGVLDFTPALQGNNLQIDDTGPTFAGVINQKTKVYIDPYASGGQYMTMGFRGQSAFDAGIFYCPYVPLQMVNAVDPETFTPKIGFKTRYGVIAHPFAEGATKGSGALTKDANVYYRKFIINNLM